MRLAFVWTFHTLRLYFCAPLEKKNIKRPHVSAIYAIQQFLFNIFLSSTSGLSLDIIIILILFSFCSGCHFRWKFGSKITDTSASVKQKRKRWLNKINTIRFVRFPLKKKFYSIQKLTDRWDRPKIGPVLVNITKWAAIDFCFFLQFLRFYSRPVHRDEWPCRFWWKTVNHVRQIRTIAVNNRISSTNNNSNNNNSPAIHRCRAIIMLLLSAMWPIPIRQTPRPLYCPATMVANTLRCCNSHATTHWCPAVWQWPIEIKIISWEIVISSSAAAIYRCKGVHGNWCTPSILFDKLIDTSKYQYSLILMSTPAFR